MDVLDSKPEDISKALYEGNLKLTVIGCGVMGLPLACLYANAGAQVYGVDANVRLIEELKRGVCPNPEPGLKKLLRKVLNAGRLHPTTDFKVAVGDSDVVMIVVSASIDSLGLPDYSSLRRVSENLGLAIRRGCLIVQSSTTGPGVTERMVKERIESLSGLKTETDFGLAYSPLRGSSGSLLRDLVNYPRIVGAAGPRSLKAAEVVLRAVVEGGVVAVKDIKTAETVKLFENCYRFTALVLSQELAMLCEKIGVDYMEVLKAAKTQPYCHLLKPSVGVGGHLPKDIQLLQASSEETKFRLRMLKTAMRINKSLLKRNRVLVSKALRKVGKPLRRSKILVLGISFKPNVKDTRGSHSIRLVEELMKKGARVIVYDPHFTSVEIRQMGFEPSPSLGRALKEVDCVVIATPHDRFKSLTLSAFKKPSDKPTAIVDFGRIFDGDKAREMGLVYVGVGAGVVD